MTSRGELSVVHLVRYANGWEPFEEFMCSYEQHTSGVAHQLVVAVKGFPGSEVPASVRQRVESHGGEFLPLEDVGFDLGSYWAVGEALSSPLMCFLNSFSVILDDGWLEKMLQHEGPTVGIIGASGSWESHFSTWSTAARPSFLLPPWRLAPPPLARRLTMRDRGWLLREWLQQRRSGFPPFPNPHVRTNAFLIRKELMTRIRVPEIRSKQDALAFESGRLSLTRQIVESGLSALIAGRNGVAYQAAEWPKSATFRSGDQENLLVADKRTNEWLIADPETKKVLTGHSWGAGDAQAIRLPRIFRGDPR